MPGSHSAGHPAALPPVRDTRPGPVFYIILVSAIALFSAEVWTITLGFLWALSGILSLGLAGTTILALLLVPAAAVATWKLAVMAFEGERDLLRQSRTDT